MTKFKEDELLRRWKSEGFPKNFSIDKAIERYTMVLEHRSERGLNSPHIYFCSIEQVEERLKWLKHHKKVSETRLWRVLNEKN